VIIFTRYGNIKCVGKCI